MVITYKNGLPIKKTANKGFKPKTKMNKLYKLIADQIDEMPRKATTTNSWYLSTDIGENCKSIELRVSDHDKGYKLHPIKEPVSQWGATELNVFDEESFQIVYEYIKANI